MPFIYPSYPLLPNYGHPLLRNIQGLWQFGGQGAVPKELLTGTYAVAASSIANSSRLGATREYNGSSQYEHYGNLFNQGAKDFTVLACARSDVAGGEHDLMSKGDATTPDYFEARFQLSSSGGPWRFLIADGAGYATVNGSTVVAKQDSVIIGVRIGGTLHIFCNGLKFTAAGLASSCSNSGNFNIGRTVTDGASANFWDGHIYSAAIWNRALSDGEALLLSLNPGLLFKQQEYWRYVSLAARSLIFNTRRSFNNSILVR